MLITAIEAQKKREERFSVFIDGEFRFGMSGTDILFFKLKQGEDITEERFGYIMDNVIFTKARDKALHFLGYRQRSEKELRDKLSSSDYSEEVIGRIIELMEKYNYIDDEKFAADYTAAKLKTCGKLKIIYELRQKGIAEELIQKSFEQNETDEAENALMQLKKKMKMNAFYSEDLDRKERQRLNAFLLRKGFSYEVIEEAFSRMRGRV